MATKKAKNDGNTGQNTMESNEENTRKSTEENTKMDTEEINDIERQGKLIRTLGEMCAVAISSWENAKLSEHPSFLDLCMKYGLNVNVNDRAGDNPGMHENIVGTEEAQSVGGEDEVVVDIERVDGTERVVDDSGMHENIVGIEEAESVGGEDEVVVDIERVDGTERAVDDSGMHENIVGTEEAESVGGEDEVVMDIERVDGTEDSFEDVGRTQNGGGRETEKTLEKGKEVVEAGNEADSSDSEDRLYMGDSGSLDTEESVVDEFELSDMSEEEDDLGLYNVDGPPVERNGLAEDEEPFFMLGMTFADRQELKRAVDKYAIAKGVNLRVVRSEKRLVQVVCEVGCPWRLYASSVGLDAGLEVRTYNFEHSCSRVYKNVRASVKWLAEEFKEKIQERPQLTVNEVKIECERDFNIHVSTYKCKRAKRRIMEDMEGASKTSLLS